jgi:predicted alpha/beta-hydrolase family hydrolase
MTNGQQDTELLDLDTAQGPARWWLDRAEQPAGLLVLGHGAGGGPAAPDLTLLARRLPSLGFSVARFEQPWRLAGRKIAVAPPKLDEAWLEAVPWLAARLPVRLPLHAGGRSAGARVACRTAEQLGVASVVCLAFPLHLPGRPERSRVAELLAPPVPRLVLQGSRDTFGGTAEVAAAIEGEPGVRLVDLPGADHGYRLATGSAMSAAELRDLVLLEVAEFLRGE